MSKIELLKNNRSLFEAIGRGVFRARAEGRKPRHEVAASYLAAVTRIHYDLMIKLVNELVEQYDEEVSEHELEMASFDRDAWEWQHSRYNHVYVI